MEAIGDSDWNKYLELWEQYETSVERSIAVWSPGGACRVNNAPVKSSREECTKEKIDQLQKTVDQINRLVALGRLIMNRTINNLDTTLKH